MQLQVGPASREAERRDQRLARLAHAAGHLLHHGAAAGAPQLDDRVRLRGQQSGLNTSALPCNKAMFMEICMHCSNNGDGSSMWVTIHNVSV